jgi:hypothetical protein
VARLVVRNIEADAKSRLQRNAVRETEAPSGGLGTAIASLFTKIGSDNEFPEPRGCEPEPASFNR